MKRYLLWSFERGSPQYDVICAIIVAFIFLTPTIVFSDRQDYMRFRKDEAVRQTRDDNGNTVYTVQIQEALFSSEDENRKVAEQRLNQVVGGGFKISKAVPIVDTVGRTWAYAIWIEK